MFGGHLDYFQQPSLGGRPNIKPGDHGSPKDHNCWFILFYHVWEPTWMIFIEIAFGWGPGHIWLHTTIEDPWPHYMILEVSWDNLWTLSFGLSQFHGHGSWLVCEVARKHYGNSNENPIWLKWIAWVVVLTRPEHFSHNNINSSFATKWSLWR
jgi:hypothetical protein